jgi:hypothetical protein
MDATNRGKGWQRLAQPSSFICVKFDEECILSSGSQKLDDLCSQIKTDQEKI